MKNFKQNKKKKKEHEMTIKFLLKGFCVCKETRHGYVLFLVAVGRVMSPFTTGVW